LYALSILITCFYLLFSKYSKSSTFSSSPHFLHSTWPVLLMLFKNTFLLIYWTFFQYFNLSFFRISVSLMYFSFISWIVFLISLSCLFYSLWIQLGFDFWILLLNYYSWISSISL
jgi:hypothetical protein